jgi:hypothetical protein
MQVLDQKQSVLVMPNIHINARNWSKIATYQVDFKIKQSNFLPLSSTFCIVTRTT